MTTGISDTDLQALIGRLTGTPATPAAAPPAAPTKRPHPCDDMFCAGTPSACGWTPVEHMARPTGGTTMTATTPPVSAAMQQARAEMIAAYPPHVIAAGGPDHYAAGQAQALHAAILAADWVTVRAIANDRYAAGEDQDTARGALAAVDPAPTTPPPSTVEVMRHVLDDLDLDRPRSRQTALGPSELGTPCQRQIAYKLAGVPRQPEDKRPPWAPMQGTAVHGLMEEALRFHNARLGRERWLVEERLEVDPGLPGVPGIYGHGDAYDLDQQMVVDWKHTGVTTLREVSRKTVANDQLVKPEYRVQAHLYGYGHQRAGRDVKWVRLVFLARSHDYSDSREWTERYDPAIAIKAVDRYYATHDLLNSLNPAANPQLWAVVPAQPGKACDWCPFRRVGGPADGTGCPGNTQTKIDKQLSGLLG